MVQEPSFQIHLPDLKSNEQLFLETIYSLANGHFGVRDSNPFQGNADQFLGAPGLFVNGFYDYRPLSYGEKYSNYAENDQIINRLMDPRALQMIVGTSDSRKTPFDILLLDKNLDMKTGQLKEKFAVTTPAQEQFHLMIESFASLADEAVYGIRYSVLPLNFNRTVTIIKQHDNVNQNTNEPTDDVRVNHSMGLLNGFPLSNKLQPAYEVMTSQSQQSVTLTWHLVDQEDDMVSEMELNTPDELGYRTTYQAEAGRLKQLSFIYGIGPVVNNNEGFSNADFLKAMHQVKFDEAFAVSAEKWAKFWQHSDIAIDGDKSVQTSLRFDLFQLNQSVGRDGRTNIPAKGLTGNGYGGQYFWDTEIFMLPFFIYTQPQTARKLLEFRAQTLPMALQQARNLGFLTGATFAWRTINGREASSYWPAGLAQFHINADIAYAIDQYVTVTEDYEFLRQSGFEMLVQTARFWLEYGNYAEIDGKRWFVINTVTGPDEYSALVNNNYYTNVMVQHNLEMAVKYAHILSEKDADLLSWLGITDAEIEAMTDAARSIYLPYDQQKQIKLQFQDFNQLKRMPLEDIDSGKFPLLLHHHPLTLYHYQVNKQADTVLADILFPNGNPLEQLKRDYDFYEPITSHDSSLSRSSFAILAARIGYADEAYNFFTEAVQTDLLDLQKNTANGIHAGNAGESWQAIIYGFAGVMNNAAVFTLQPHLPIQWQRLAFKLTLRDCEYAFEIMQTEVTVTLVKGGYGKMVIANQTIELTSDHPAITVSLPTS